MGWRDTFSSKVRLWFVDKYLLRRVSDEMVLNRPHSSHLLLGMELKIENWILGSQLVTVTGKSSAVIGGKEGNLAFPWHKIGKSSTHMDKRDSSKTPMRININLRTYVYG